MVNYPGMIEAESRILREFIRRHWQAGDEWRFNLRIGEGQKLDDTVDTALRKSWESITRARPDTCRFRPPHTATLIEVKEWFVNEGVWQLLGYRDLYRQTFPDDVVDLVGIAQMASPTARQLAQAQGVALYLYTFGPSGTPDISPVATETPNGI